MVNVNPVLRELLDTQIVSSADGKSYPLRGNVPMLEAQIMQAWIERYKPCRLLEIGMGYAISTLFICDVLLTQEQFESYHVIDPHQLTAFHDLGLYNLTRAGYREMFTFHRSPSEVCLPDMWSEDVRIDFVFIDGGHSFYNVFVDYFYASRMLDPGGIILFDDIQFEEVGRVVEHLESSGDYQRLAIPEEFDNHKTVQVRRLTGAEPSRIVGYRKR